MRANVELSHGDVVKLMSGRSQSSTVARGTGLPPRVTLPVTVPVAAGRSAGSAGPSSTTAIAVMVPSTPATVPGSHCWSSSPRASRITRPLSVVIQMRPLASTARTSARVALAASEMSLFHVGSPGAVMARAPTPPVPTTCPAGPAARSSS